MSKTILSLFVLAVIAASLYSCVAGSFIGSQDNWSPRNYVVKEGECWVHPQGDPLYDEHYAKNVNNQNCNAFKTQEEGKYLGAQTKQVEWDTQQGKFGVYSTLGVLFGVLICIVIATIKG